MVGLGNPGPRYEANRHNVGFMVVEELGAELREGLGGLWGRASVDGREIAVLLPHTFMNRSGVAVAAALEALDLRLDEVLVVHDDLDLPFGVVKLKRGGGAGGHNGLKSIIARCGDPGFDRLRIGIGRPAEGSIVDWVLGDFEESDGGALNGVLDESTRAIAIAVAEGTSQAMSSVNARAKLKTKPSSLPPTQVGAPDREEP